MRILQNGLKLTRSGVKTMLIWVLVCFLFLLVFFFMVWLMTLALRETLHLPRSSWARLLAFYSYWNIWPHNALHCHNRTRLEAYWQKTFGTFWSSRLFLQENRSREENGVKNNLACVHAYLDLALVKRHIMTTMYNAIVTLAMLKTQSHSSQSLPTNTSVATEDFDIFSP